MTVKEVKAALEGAGDDWDVWVADSDGSYILLKEAEWDRKPEPTDDPQRNKADYPPNVVYLYSHSY